ADCTHEDAGPDGGGRRGGEAHRRGHGAQPRQRGGREGGVMPKHGKRYRTGAAPIDRARRYPMDEAVRTLLGAGGGAKFDESVEVAVRLGGDPRPADQNARGTVVLPHGTGKSVRVLA